MGGGARRRLGDLPVDLTNMVGRRAESAEAVRRLSESRLVTMTGTGGVGKSRLARHVARQLRESFPDGVRFIRLAELANPQLLELTVLSALTGSALMGAGIGELADSIGEQRVLLVLDNCEHLVEACATMASDLLRACPNAHLLATSREPLRIDGETLLHTPTLSVPDPKQDTSLGVLTRYDAVALFLDRASAVDPGFSLTADNAQEILTLCRRLDGLPLAIELAAARTRSLSVHELLQRHDDRFRILTCGSRAAEPRHRTLRAAMDHSHDLCSAPARLLWARMAVFAGDARLDAIEHVGAGEDLPLSEVQEALSELVDKSVVSFDGTRYRMLETIRQYGRDRLRELGGEHAVGRVHLEHFAALAARLESGWFSADQAALLNRTLTELSDIRAALEFSLAHCDLARVGLRMASDLWPLWFVCGLQAEGRRWLDRLLAADTEHSRERAAALWANGHLALHDGAVPAGFELLDECGQLADRLGDQAIIARASLSRGLGEFTRGHGEAAHACLEEAVRLERLIPGDSLHLTHSLVAFGAVSLYSDHLDRGVAALEEARDRCDAHGEQWLLTWILVHLGNAALFQRRIGDAVHLLKEGLTRKHALNDVFGISSALEFLAWAEAAGGDAARAARLLGAAKALAAPLGAHLASAGRMVVYRDHYLRRAREALGPAAFAEALDAGHRLNMDDAVAYALEEGPAPALEAVADDDLPLTPRECEVAHLITVGQTNKEIAAKLVIARRTVDSHVENILSKLGFASRTQVAAFFAARRNMNVLPHPFVAPNLDAGR